MTNVGFKMYLKPGMEEEYRKRHNAIWPELVELLHRQGVSDYTIFLDRETNTLFGVQKTEGGADSQKQGVGGIVQKWWDYMADLMDTNADNSPVTVHLDEVFHMD